jgi:hypothetical protein
MCADVQVVEAFSMQRDVNVSSRIGIERVVSAWSAVSKTVLPKINTDTRHERAHRLALHPGTHVCS